MIDMGESFATLSLKNRLKIAQTGWAFVQEGMTILTHGSSRVVIALLLEVSYYLLLMLFMLFMLIQCIFIFVTSMSACYLYGKKGGF